MRLSNRSLHSAFLLSCIVLAPPALHALDCNRNGADDTADIASGFSEDCDQNAIPDECEGAPVEMSLDPRFVEVPSSPRDLRSGDLDADGDLDLVIGSRLQGSSSISVLLNRGDRTFEPLVVFEGEGDLYRMALADLDGDGDPDLATASGEVIWLFENRGDGSFGAPEVHTPGGETRFLIAGDADGDGDLDLIAADRASGSVSVLANDGAGGFSHLAATPVGDEPLSVTPGDFDGDGHLDVATVSRRSGDVAVLLGDGGGAFRLAEAHDLAGHRPSSLEAVDLDRDGSPDLVLTTSTSYAAVMNRGDGSFRVPVHYDGFGLDLAVGDVDGDGDADLAMGARPDFVSIKRNDGLGRLGVVAEFNAAGLPSALALADFDGDGLADIAAMSSIPSGVSLLWNGEGESLAVTTQMIDALVRCGSCRPHAGSAADLDGDGDLDVLGATTHPGNFVALINDGRGVLVPQPGNTFTAERPLSIDTGHLDGDGRVDAISIDNRYDRLHVHLGRGDGRFGRAQPYPITAGGAPISVRLGDLDGDGDLDAAVANFGKRSVTVLFNQGDATFDRQGLADLRVGASPKTVEVADLDGDGDVDIAVANSNGPQLSVLLNEGAGTFAPAVHLGPGEKANFVAAGDLDDDGDVDLVTARPFGNSCSVFLNHGGGTATFARPLDFDVARAPFSVTTLDFDGDGVLDLVTGNEDNGSVSILLGRRLDGEGRIRFAPPVHIETAIGTRFVLPGDYDLDGDPDLVTTNRDGQSFTVIYNDASLLGAPDYSERICTPAALRRLSARPGGQGAAARFVKFTHPLAAGAALASTVYQNTTRFPLHEEFLARVFPDQFPALDPATYDRLVGFRATRQYFVGTVSELRGAAGETLYGVSVFARFQDLRERLAAPEVKDLLDGLRASFLLGPLVYYPRARAAVEVAEGWDDPGFEIYFDHGGPASTRYEPYTRAIGYGRVRILGEAEFEAANRSGELSFRDVIVLERAPRDIEGVVAGVVTAEPQGELSHVAIRTNRRGTPNAFVADALQAFAELEGRLIRLEVAESEYTIEEVTPAQAEAFWASSRPRLSVQPSLDPDFAELSSLEAISLMDSAAMDRAGEVVVEGRFGGKATNLARLQTILDGPWAKYRLEGFGIPVRYYLEFIRSNRLPSALDPARRVTYEEYLGEVLDADELRLDSALRFAALERLREHMEEEGEVDPELVSRLASRIQGTYAHLPESHRVRFRSSSNVEDAIEFNGAGLYESTSVCALDDLDGDDAGPSLCDASRRSERGIARGLKRVWSSLWSFRAFEERAFYGIEQRVAAMGVLSNAAFIDERANGVAFTGNPANPLDRRYVITAQAGEESVVSPEPGVLPEKDILEMGDDGRVIHIIRAVPSTLLPGGEYVLSDGELEELGALLWHIDTSFPVDPGVHAREDVLLDVEFKIEKDGTLAVKQVRPFLLTNPEPEAPTFTLEVPPGTVGCALFTVGRTAREEHDLKAQLHFRAGSFDIPTAVETFTTTIVDQIVIGPAREVAAAASPGLLHVERRPLEGGLAAYRLRYQQRLTLPDGARVELELSGLEYRTRDGVPIERAYRLDSSALTDDVFAQSSSRRGDEFVDLVFTSCEHDTLPVWEVRAELEDGASIVFEERYRPELTRDFGPASLRRAELVLGGTRYLVDDYWNLVYSATRHNTHAVYWAVLDAPVVVPGVEAPVRAVELRAPIDVEGVPAAASYLGEDLEVLAPVGIVSYGKEPVIIEPGERFRRGDVNADGDLDLADAVSLLEYLFRRGAAPACPKAADANDDGALGIVDAVAVLLHLAGGVSLPAPEGCGSDPTPDGLECAAFAACR